VSSIEYAAAPRSVNVLPTRASRKLTRRDGLLPLVLAVELFVGVAFGLASTAGSSQATSVPARITLEPIALVTVLASSAPVAPMPTVGPAIGPLLPGTTRASLPPVEVQPVDAQPVEVQPVEVQPAEAVPAPAAYPTHAPRDPFAALVTATP
jgi:hypothetical protein